MYSIKSLSKITGIPTNTLRSWERRYGIPAAQRDESGFRLYTPEDVAYVALIGRLVSQGHAISKVASLSPADLHTLETKSFTSTPDDGRDILRKRLFEAVHSRDLSRYRMLLAQALVACPPADVCSYIVSPVLREIGRRWEAGKLDVALEHGFSAITKQLLFASVNTVQWGAARVSIAFATLPGERHELGALMAYFIASMRGYQTTYFGPDVPLDSLAEAALVVKARVLVLSCISPPDINEVSRITRNLAATLSPGAELWMGTSLPIDTGSTDILLFDTFEAFDKHLIAFS